MNKLVLSLIAFIIHFCSYANNPCQPVFWNSNQKAIENKQSLPDLVNQMREHFYLKAEEIEPDIEIKELKIQPETYSSSYNDQRYKIATRNGEKVFLKQIIAPHGEDELAILLTFNQIGVPTLFQGVVRDTHDTLYMVNKFKEGKTLRSPWKILAHTTEIQNEHYESVHQQLREIKFFLSSANILPRDLQIIVTGDGKVYLIDVEFYLFLGGENSKKVKRTLLDKVTQFKSLFKRLHL